MEGAWDKGMVGVDGKEFEWGFYDAMPVAIAPKDRMPDMVGETSK